MTDDYLMLTYDGEIYRAPRATPLQMERQRRSGEWEPFAGDAAKILWLGSWDPALDHARVRSRRVPTPDEQRLAVCPGMAVRSPAGSATARALEGVAGRVIERMRAKAIVAVANHAGKLDMTTVGTVVAAMDRAAFTTATVSFTKILATHATARATEAITTLIGLKRYGPTLGHDVPDLYENARRAAAAWAERRAGELVRGLDEVTQENLRGVLTEGITANWSEDEFVTALSDAYGFSESRARTIAQTETAFADTQGAIIGWRSSERAVGKQWLAQSLACDRCAALDGVVEDLDAPFITVDGSDWVDGPPLHPNCYCSLTPVLGDVRE